MQKPISPNHVFRLLKRPACRLCTVWLIGLLLGTLFSVNLDDTFSSLMRPSISEGLSIFRQLAMVCLPFLFAAYAVSINKPGLLLLLCFVKAFCFAFCGMLIYYAFGSAGWLVRYLLQFTDVLSVPILFWYCLRHIDRQNNAKRDLMICALLAASIACIDYFAVSPFLAELIDHSMGRYAYSCWI